CTRIEMNGCDSSVVITAGNEGRVASVAENVHEGGEAVESEEYSSVGLSSDSDFNEKFPNYQSHAFLKARKNLEDMEIDFLCRDVNFDRINSHRKSQGLDTVSKKMIEKMNGYNGSNYP
ncbi:MAG: hypothetical protein ACK559_14590, partial [bacterium]